MGIVGVWVALFKSTCATICVGQGCEVTTAHATFARAASAYGLTADRVRTP